MDKSPSEQPIRHLVVFTMARFQVWRHFQKARLRTGLGIVVVWTCWRDWYDLTGDVSCGRCKDREYIEDSLGVHNIGAFIAVNRLEFMCADFLLKYGYYGLCLGL